jgi:hypothetical protein
METTMKTLLLGAVAGVSLLLAGPSYAHHAVQASVDINQHVEVDAILTSIQWTNPHTWMFFDVRMPDGTVMRNVAVESLGIAGLRRAGFTSRDAFQVGTSYRITFYPNRDGSPGGFMSRMVLPDGRNFDTRNEDPTSVQ